MVKWLRPELRCRRPGFESPQGRRFCRRVWRGLGSAMRHYGAKLGGRERHLLQQINKMKSTYIYTYFLFFNFNYRILLCIGFTVISLNTDPLSFLNSYETSGRALGLAARHAARYRRRGSIMLTRTPPSPRALRRHVSVDSTIPENIQALTTPGPDWYVV